MVRICRTCPADSREANTKVWLLPISPWLWRTHASAIEPHLGRLAGFENNLFAALNTAYLHHGALIIVPRNAKIQKPVHVLFIATQAGTASHPRCLLIAQAGSAGNVGRGLCYLAGRGLCNQRGDGNRA